MTSKPSDSESKVPDSVLRGAAHDEQLQAAARSWNKLPQLTRDKMLERAARYLDPSETASDDTRPSARKETSTQLPRTQGAPHAGDHDSSATARRRQAPPPSVSGGSSSRSARRSAIQAMPPGPARRRALIRFFVSFGTIALVFGIAFWAIQPATPLPENILGRLDLLLRSAAKSKSAPVRQLSWPGTESDAIAFSLEVSKLLPEKFQTTEESPLRKYQQITPAGSEHDTVRTSMAIPIDQTAHPDLPADVPVILFWQRSPEKGWLLNGREARSYLSRALKSARRATQNG